MSGDPRRYRVLIAAVDAAGADDPDTYGAEWIVSATPGEMADVVGRLAWLDSAGES